MSSNFLNKCIIMSSQKPPVICIMGPTASGKTRLAYELFDALDARLISVDSAQVYKGMDIGAAKPSESELQAYPHDLIDVVHPYEPFDVNQFCELAKRSIRQAHAQNKVAILVGGTMLYFRALMQGLAQLPSATAELRKQLGEQGQAIGWPKMHARLMEVDAQTASRLEPNDAQRIQRALEVFETSGIPMSEWLARQEPIEPEFNFLSMALDVTLEQRPKLRQTIRTRFEAMIEQGFIDEVKGLMSQPWFDEDLSAFRAVGYRQVIEHLLGHISLEAMIDKAAIATGQLAKRQLTWLRRWPNCVKLNAYDPSICEKVLALYEANQPQVLA